MTRPRTTQPHRTLIHHDELVDPISRSVFTIDAHTIHAPDGTITHVAIHPRIGPGVGPHTTPNADWVTAIGWACINTGHAIRRTLHQPDPAPFPGQLTFEDA